MPATGRTFRTRFRFASAPEELRLATDNNSQTHYAKGRLSPLARLQHIVCNRFQVYFTPLAGVLFTFPSRYWFTIGCQVVFSLIQWSGRIHAEFHVHRITWDTPRRLQTSHTRLSRSLVAFSIALCSSFTYHIEVPQPRRNKFLRFRLFRFRSPLLTESILILFLRILRCFTSPRVAQPVLCIQTGATPYERRQVSPFGNLRIKACVPLPEAYRSLLRPSSPDDAKASINCCNWFVQTLTILGVYFTFLYTLHYP